MMSPDEKSLVLCVNNSKRVRQLKELAHQYCLLLAKALQEDGIPYIHVNPPIYRHPDESSILLMDPTDRYPVALCLMHTSVRALSNQRKKLQRQFGTPLIKVLVSGMDQIPYESASICFEYKELLKEMTAYTP